MQIRGAAFEDDLLPRLGLLVEEWWRLVEERRRLCPSVALCECDLRLFDNKCATSLASSLNAHLDGRRLLC
eukprot:COSAG06_NODE_33297_length_492_cov_0.788804_1_plen_70_part_10